MKKIIIIKYGELSTKKDNINFFLKTLKNNIANLLSDIPCDITYDFGRMFIDSTEDKIEEIVSRLKKVFGIHEIIIGYKDQNLNIDSIKENILTLEKYTNISEKERIEIKSLKKGENLMFVGDNHILVKVYSSDEEKELIEGREEN